MKKLISVILLLAIALTFTSCNDYPQAKTFDAKPVKTNVVTGRERNKMVYIDDTLYFAYLFGVCKADKNGVELIWKNTAELPVNPGDIYSVDGELYLDDYSGAIMKYNRSKGDFEKCKFNIPLYKDKALTLDWSDEKQNKLKISYKDQKPYTLDLKVKKFSVSGNMLYLLGRFYELYSYDLDKPKNKPRLLNYLEESGSCIEKFEKCGDYIYFDSYDTNELYRYSLSNDSSQLVKDIPVISCATYDDKMYFATEDGVYVDNPVGEPEKLLDTDGQKDIYILDDTWIYIIKEYGVDRMTMDGKTVERVKVKI